MKSQKPLHTSFRPHVFPFPRGRPYSFMISSLFFIVFVPVKPHLTTTVGIFNKESPIVRPLGFGIFHSIQKIHVYWFQRERGVGGERERNINWLPPICALTGDWTCNLDMCPDRELNPQPFGVWDDAPTSWATLARALHSILCCWSSLIFQHL